MALKIILFTAIAATAIYAQAANRGKLVAVKTMGWKSDEKAAPVATPSPTPVTPKAVAAPASSAKGITEKGIK